MTLDVLQRHEGAALSVQAGVVQARNVGVLQPGQDVALACKTLGQAGRPTQVRQLQRHLPLDAAIAALGQPHAAHAALAQRLQQAIRAYGFAGPPRVRALVIAGVVGARVLGRQLDDGAAIQPVPGFHPTAGVCCEQAAQCGGQGTVGRGQVVQPGLLSRAVQVHRHVQQRGQACQFSHSQRHACLRFEALAVKYGPAFRNRTWVYCSCANSSRRAFSQSRRTVRSVTPSAAAISASVMPPK